MTATGASQERWSQSVSFLKEHPTSMLATEGQKVTCENHGLGMAFWVSPCYLGQVSIMVLPTERDI